MPSAMMEQMGAALRAARASQQDARAGLSLNERRARFEARAAAAPLPEGLEVEAIEADGVRCESLTLPQSRPGRILLYLHGGGFCVGSPKSHRSLAARLAAAAGMSALVPDYRLAPEHPFPAAPEDVLRVYEWVLRETGAAPAALAGDSAGGCLALCLLVTVRDRGLPAPDAAALLSPCTDLSLSGASLTERAARDPFLTPAQLKGLHAAYAGDTDRRDPALSPLFADLAGLPPLLIEAGSEEILYDDAVRLARKATAAGVAARLHIGEGLFHVYHGFAPAPEAEEGAERVGAFLASQPHRGRMRG